jgi:hypothetical protein
MTKSAHTQSRLFEYLTKQPEKTAKNHLKVGDQENCKFRPTINKKSIKIDEMRK